MLGYPKELIMSKTLEELIYFQNPYQDLKIDDYPAEGVGSSFTKDLWDYVLKTTQPDYFLEVGSWKGGSAIDFAKHLKSIGSPTKIVCVDTWIGTYYHRMNQTEFNQLKATNNFPRLYETFLSNVVRAGVQDYIIPLPLPSIEAARFFTKQGTKFKAIYVDASHEYIDVYLDLCFHWENLAPGGIMFGDDYSETWSGVINDTNKFARERNVQLEIPRIFQWLMRKPNV